MPIGKRPVSRTDMYFPQVVLPSQGQYSLWEAVGIVRIGNVQEYRRCGALDYAENFCGFLSYVPGPGAAPTVTTVRGAILTPILEHGTPLVQDQPVYLAETPGQVSQAVPSTPGAMLVRVGVAVSSTEIMLNTDFRAALMG